MLAKKPFFWSWVGLPPTVTDFSGGSVCWM